jgi:hypothetical protein
MEGKDWERKQLDKDLIIPGNKIYAPELCCFVTPYINSIFTNCHPTNRNLPTGVTVNRAGGYAASCRNGPNSNPYIGIYDTAEEAHNAWALTKGKILRFEANNQSDMTVRNALFRQARLIEEKQHGGAG